MGEKDMGAREIERGVLDLAKSMDRVKNRQADRDDVVVEMLSAKKGRLELLAEDLSDVIDSIPDDVEIFECGLTNGENPRLWVDITSFVRLAKDGRTYEFVKDTRLGRTILASFKNREKMGQAVTDYVAERILERERAIEGEWVSLKSRQTHTGNACEEKELGEEVKSEDLVLNGTVSLDETTPECSQTQVAGAVAAIGEVESEKPRKVIRFLKILAWVVLIGGLALAVAMYGLNLEQSAVLREWLAGTQ